METRTGRRSERVRDDDALPDSVTHDLRSMIIRGSLLPGEHLGQTQLAARFGRSKVPIREALKRLAAEGFLRHDRNRGYFVAPLEYPEAAQLYKLRRWVEAELLETARWPTVKEVHGFRRQFDALERIDQTARFNEWALALEDLRYAIFDLSPQKVLLREATRLWMLTDRYRCFFPRDEEESPERALIDALERRDREKLQQDYHGIRDRVEALLYEVFGSEGEAPRPYMLT